MKLFITNFLVGNYFVILKSLLLINFVILLFNLNHILIFLKEIKKKTWYSLLGIILIGFGLRMYFVPHVHHVYFDEFEHINIAENIMYNGKASVTQMGANNFCESGSLPFWPMGYHTILAIVFSVFGDSELVAYNLSAIIGSLSLLIVFLLSYLLFNNQFIALGSAFLFNLIPVHLKYSGASDLSIVSLFFVLFSILSAIIYLKLQNVKSLLLFIFSIGLTSYMRPENGLVSLLLVFVVAVALFLLNINKETIYLYCALTVSLLFLLLIPYFLHLYIGWFITPPPGWRSSIFSSLHNFKVHIVGNIMFWFSDFHPLSFTLFAILGIVRLSKKNKKILFFFLSWFAIFLLLYSQYIIGGFIKNADGDRYTLNLYISIIIFAAFGLSEFINLFNSKKIVTGFILTYIFIEIFSPLRLGLNRTLQRDVYQEYKFILSSKSRIPDNLYVISYEPPAIISTIHKMAVSPYIFVRLKNMPKEAILFKDYWWYQNDSESINIEKELKEIYNFELLSQKEIPNGAPFSFIKLKMKNSEENIFK